MKNFLKLALKVGITAFALYWVFSNTDMVALSERISRSNPYYLFLAFLAFVVSQFFASARVHSFFVSAGLKLSPLYNYKLYLLGMFYNMFLPGGIGGDGYKIFFLNKTFGTEKKKLLTAVFLDKLSGVWALCVLIILMLLFIPDIGVAYYLLAILFIGTVIYFFLYKYLFGAYFKLFIPAHIKALGLQFMQVVSVAFILQALGFEGSFFPYLILFLASAFMALFPFTIGGLGSRELVFLYGAKYFVLDPQLAVSVSLVFFVVSAVASLPGVYFVFRGGELEERIKNHPKNNKRYSL